MSKLGEILEFVGMGMSLMASLFADSLGNIFVIVILTIMLGIIISIIGLKLNNERIEDED